MSSKIIEVNHLTKAFTFTTKEPGLRGAWKGLFSRQMEEKTAVSQVSFDVYEGEIIGFLGPNGAGKTTTLKMLSGILYPSAGEASVLGYVPWKRETALKKQISFIMGQKNQLWWDLPASESFLLIKYLYDIDTKDYKRNLEELVELTNVQDCMHMQVRRLSFGQRMKMELIAALLHKPRVVFLDEPTIGLDLISQKNIRNFLKSYNRENKTTIMLTSHYLEDIQDLCKRSVIMNGGTVVYDGELHQVNDIFNKKVIKLQFSDRIDVNHLDFFGKVTKVTESNATLEIDRHEVKPILAALMSEFPITDVDIHDIPIEEAITWLYERKGVHQLP
ncbi:ABC transporter ATP-binding protein [Paenibacillus guangzhouensis]|uniref:ABC transporter ATP-binding protein n=1 Tax=Paenibacillus guangzhouensis TaxID=1473112 RepID=UPI001266BD95|nr:ATP-binding cassette domain-containing protein [Paenibacillus guangzhouensis]